MEIKRRFRKKGAFFSLDAVIALSIVFSIIVLAVPVILKPSVEKKTQQDIINTLSEIKVGNLQNSYVQGLVQNGTIQDSNKSVLEAIGEIYAKNNTLAQLIAQSVLSTLSISDNYGIWYGSTLLYSNNPDSLANAKEIHTAKAFLSGIESGENTVGFSARAFLSRSAQTKYFYFGGYVGDGNISVYINYTGNLSSASMELAINKSFDLYVNGIHEGSYSGSSSDFIPSTYSIPTNHFASGNNIIDINGSNLHITGGFIKIVYDSSTDYEQPTRQYLPGIRGTINLFDGFYVPSTLQSLNVYLHYNSSYETRFNIGGVNVYNSTSPGVVSVLLNDTYLRGISGLDYNSLSNTTTPIRLGLVNLSLVSGLNSTADVILITDTSGSMDWRMDSDVTGTHRLCNNVLINDPSTKRIDIAKCIDVNFVSTILNTSGNRVGLVPFSTSVNTYVNLTSNFTALNNSINTYSASGSTCISCAINQAYTILQSMGSPNRLKYIIVMTDGVANQRSTAECYDINSISGRSSSTFSVGDSGLALQYSGSWNPINSFTSSNLNGIDVYSNSLAFAVGDSYQTFKWTGSSWALDQDLGTQNLYGVNIYNSTLAFAVGQSGKIAKWSGSSWTEDADLGSFDVRGVKIWNSTFGFAVGSSGNIYKWSGSSWTSNASVTGNLYSVDMLNGTFAFAVGSSGKIYSWNGRTWTQNTDLGGMILTSVQIYNSTLAFAAGDDNHIYKWSGSSWTSDYTGTASLNTIKILNSNLGFAAGPSIGGVVQWSGSSWTSSYPPYLIDGTSTTGLSCGDDDSCSLTTSIPALNANYSACRAHSNLNSTVHSVGFGPVATCSFASQTLQAVASCGNGSYYASSNATALQEFYQNIANSIISLSYKEQTSQTSGSLITQLYPDSYIEFQYPKVIIPAGQIVSLESPFTDSYSGAFSTPANSRAISANAVSYSGPRWTYTVEINNVTIYNLSRYGSDFVELGDPYSISMPTSLIAQNNTVRLQTAVSAQNISAGSVYNKIIYQLLINVSSFSPIAARVDGCKWNITFEDGTNSIIKVPTNYTGEKNCSYTPALIQYESDDAFQAAVYNLLSQLDLNKNDKVDTNLQQGSFSISESEVNGIPYPWSTEVQVRTWR